MSIQNKYFSKSFPTIFGNTYYDDEIYFLNLLLEQQFESYESEDTL
jgi:hypothetical protein